MKNKGFTLIELMVVISIIGILSVVFLANYRGGEREFALKRSIHQLSLDFRRAQEMAVGTQEFKGAFQGGYGIFLTENQEDYVLFVDCDSNGYFSGSSLVCSDCTGGSCILGQYTEAVEEVSLEGGVYVSFLSPNFNNNLSVLFSPPDPTVTFYPDDTVADISIQSEVAGELKTSSLQVNKAGLISIE